MNSLIIGGGEVGKSLYKILQNYHPTRIINKTEEKIEGIDIIHICFPYSEEFESEVKRYQALYNPKYTVIHSTVPVGTSRRLNAVNSPVLGVHPYLDEGIKIFIKFLGGEKTGEIADYFRRANIKVYITDRQESTELMKIMDTTYYGLCIEYTKEVKRLCGKYKVPFELWTLWTDNYNRGYKELKQEQFTRPNLVPMLKKIAGHCVLQNAVLLKSKFTKFLLRLNK